MRARRLLVALAAALLSSGFAYAQTSVKGDINHDGVADAKDLPALADSIMQNKQSTRLDVNGDSKVNVADITAVANIINSKDESTGYFWIGKIKPTLDNYQEKEGIVTTYKSLDDAITAPSTLAVVAKDWGVILCPTSWGASADDLVMQDGTIGTIYTLKKTDSNIPGHDIFQTKVKFAAAGTIYLRKKADAQAKFPNAKVDPDSSSSDSGSGTSGNSGNNNNNTPSGGTSTNAISYATAGTANAVTFNLINQTGQDVYFSGKFKMYIKQGNSLNGWDPATNTEASGVIELECHLNGPTYTGDGWPHWWSNPNKIANGGSKQFVLTNLTKYTGNGVAVSATPISWDTYTNGNWYFLSTNNAGFETTNGSGGIPAIKLGCAVKKSDGSIGDNSILFNVSPVKASDAKLEKGKTYNLIIYKAHTESSYWNRIVR